MEDLEVTSLRIRHETKPRTHHTSRFRPVSQSGRSPKSSSRSNTARPGSMPPLWGHEAPLKVQSTPVSLATRSLSSRSVSSTANTKPSISSSSRKKGASSARKHGQPSQRPATVHLPPSSRSISSGVEGAKPEEAGTSSTTGFNITAHLRDRQAGGAMDRSSGSLSPEVDQFLLDINAAIRSMTPEHKQRSANRGHSSSQRPKSKTPPPSLSRRNGKKARQSSDPTAQYTKPLPHSPPQELAVYETSDESAAEDVSMEHKAAATIQHWYRGRTRHRQLSQVQSLLHSKREELDQSRLEEMARLGEEAELRERKEAERERRKLAKMQEARRAAIEGLQRKREEKRKQNEKIAQEEIALLQASGKIKRPRTSQRKKPHTEKHKSAAASAERSDDRQARSTLTKEAGKDKSNGDSKRPSGDVIDQFFEAGNIRYATPPPPPPVTMSTTSSLPAKHDPKTTYGDILETLKLLEEVPEPLTSEQPSSVSPPPPPTAAYLSSSNLAQLPAPPPHQQQLSEGKLQSILTYLEQMEQADSDLLSQVSKPQPHRQLKAGEATGGGRGLEGVSISGENPATQRSTLPSKKTDEVLGTELQAASAVASDVTTTILAQRLELENKDKTVEMLQKALAQQRELTVYHAKEMDKEGSRRLALQKQEYEDTIQRHQCFIDQLIDDKKVLSERCEKMVKELREVDTKYKQKIKTMTESHAAELAKIKQVSATADKLRREKWRAEETQRIKEATVKSLEPEIQRIIAKGKAEIQKLKAFHEAEMLQVDERAGQRFVSQMEELRAQCAAEKEQACCHERELARQRFEKLAEQEELNYQQQRRRLYADVQQEKDKLASQFHKQKESLEQRYREMQDEQDSVIEALKSDHVRAFGEAERRHASELRELRERVEIEKQAWEENLLRKQEATLLAKEREMREAERRERDKEIELVITRLEEETAQAREEGERALEGRIRRVREKYETELREVERSERTTLEKFNSIKLQNVEFESEVARVRSLLRQREQEIETVSQVASKLTSERDHVADVVRQEFADRLVSTEETNKQLKIDMSELRARHKVELERVGATKDREMEAVHERIKHALAKKEENLKSLRQQYDAATKRADHLEMLLERQRKQLLTTK